MQRNDQGGGSRSPDRISAGSTSPMLRLILRMTGCFVLGALSCWLAATLAQQLGAVASPAPVVSLGTSLPFWPASGAGFGVAWLFGWRFVVPVAAGVAAWTSLATGSPVLTVLSALMCLAGALIPLSFLQRLNAWKPTENRLEIALRLLVAVVVIAAPVNALLLAGSLRFDPLLMQPRTLNLVTGWWILEALGTLLIAPCVVASVRGSVGISGNLTKSTDPWLDTGAMALTTLIVLGGLLASEVGRQPFAYTLVYFFVPVAAWTAIRRSEKTLAFTLLAGCSLLFVGRSIQSTSAGAGYPPAIELSILMFVTVMVAILLQSVAADRRQAMERVRRQARQDMSTGLLNDRGLIADMTRALESDRRGHYGLLGIHIINFDTLNDLCGPVAALELERDVAAVLSRQPGQLASARLSAGRYALLLRTETLAELRVTARQVYLAFNGRLFRSTDQLLRLQPGVGGLLIDRNTQTSSEDCLVSLSQVQAIANSVHDPRLFVEPLAQSAVLAHRQQQARLEHVREAIRNNRFELHAQQISTMRGASGKLSYETLVRLIDRNGGLMAPNEFLSLAAQAHMIPALDRGVISAVFSWLTRHPIALGQTEKCSINLSGQTLSDGLIADFIREERQRFDIDPSIIVFEITESEAISNPAAAARLVNELKASGFGIALDDFGVGLATFEYLKRFSPDWLKIDGSFIRNLADDPIDQEIVRATVRVADRLGIQTVAEHVQSSQVRDQLVAMGVNYIQGDLVGPVLPLVKLFDGALATTRV